MARLIAMHTGAVWLRVDVLEAAMIAAGISRSFETGLAAYIGVRDQARDHLLLGRWVIVDAVNGVEEARKMWRDLSVELSVNRWVVELVCSDLVEHRRRVESRTSPTPPLPMPTWEEVLCREYVTWKEPVLTVDTALAVEDSLNLILAYLRGIPA